MSKKALRDYKEKNLNNYLKRPYFLFNLLREKKISLTAHDIYTLFLYRNNMSKFYDNDGKVYFTYPYAELKADLRLKGDYQINDAIKELVDLDLIDTKPPIKGRATRYYIKN